MTVLQWKSLSNITVECRLSERVDQLNTDHFVTVSSDIDSLFKSEPHCPLFILASSELAEIIEFLQNVIEEVAVGV